MEAFLSEVKRKVRGSEGRLKTTLAPLRPLGAGLARLQAAAAAAVLPGRNGVRTEIGLIEPLQRHHFQVLGTD